MYLCTCIIIIIMGGVNASELVNKNKWITVGCFSQVYTLYNLIHACGYKNVLKLSIMIYINSGSKIIWKNDSTIYERLGFR